MEPFEIMRFLVDLVDREEQLDVQWKQVWAETATIAKRLGSLSPSLFDRIDSIVNAIPGIDSQLRTLRLAESDSVCMLLGAGASAPAPSSIPTVMQLLPELWRRARKMGREDIDRLATWCDRNSIENIEDLLTAAYLANFAAKNAQISGLLDYFFSRSAPDEPAARRTRIGPSSRIDAASIALLQDTLQVLFGLLTSTMIPAPPNSGHEAIVSFVDRHRKSSVITTNYDGCIDEALSRAKRPVNFLLDDSVPPESSIDLLKIHGSINWTYCESCHDVRTFDLLRMKDDFESDTASYAVIGICRNCQGQRRPLLIPPLGFKFILFPSLIRLWNAARERIEASDYLLVVGFSFSEADSYINKIVERSMAIKDSQKIIVCDPNPKLVRSLRARFSAKIDNFDQSRILAAIGNSAEMLPDLLESFLKSPSIDAAAIDATPPPSAQPMNPRKRRV